MTDRSNLQFTTHLPVYPKKAIFLGNWFWNEARIIFEHPLAIFYEILKPISSHFDPPVILWFSCFQGGSKRNFEKKW